MGYKQRVSDQYRNYLSQQLKNVVQHAKDPRATRQSVWMLLKAVGKDISSRCRGNLNLHDQATLWQSWCAIYDSYFG